MLRLAVNCLLERQGWYAGVFLMAFLSNLLRLWCRGMMDVPRRGVASQLTGGVVGEVGVAPLPSSASSQFQCVRVSRPSRVAASVTSHIVVLCPRVLCYLVGLPSSLTPSRIICWFECEI
ncbi:uncharacterized protein LOC124357470 [Homalodisca vitripennis]|uniref:uncharacterized protein LOC124357470 n=1 Tax=Homalodisca vitripennis TaxID=197043 RepID=UPI001EEAEEDF|nr:uncharacterized protein LOC124357470 [Homalodisca vitripennis]